MGDDVEFIAVGYLVVGKHHCDWMLVAFGGVTLGLGELLCWVRWIGPAPFRNLAHPVAATAHLPCRVERPGRHLMPRFIAREQTPSNSNGRHSPGISRHSNMHQLPAQLNRTMFATLYLYTANAFGPSHALHASPRLHPFRLATTCQHWHQRANVAQGALPGQQLHR